MYNILLDKLKLFKETIIKGCKELKFSNGGHLFAAASTINVMVFDTKTFQQLVSFQGHMMAVKRMAWGPCDQVNQNITYYGVNIFFNFNFISFVTCDFDLLCLYVCFC